MEILKRSCAAAVLAAALLIPASGCSIKRDCWKPDFSDYDTWKKTGKTPEQGTDRGEKAPAPDK